MKRALILIGVLAALLAAAYVGYNLQSGKNGAEIAITSIPAVEPAEPEKPAEPEADVNYSFEAPDFEVLDNSLNTVRLSDFAGKPIIINIWATWCGPCRSELGHFDAAYKACGDKINFLMVNLTDGSSETVDGVRQFVSENGYSFPVYYDTRYSAADAYGVSAIPVTVFIDGTGKVADTRIGSMDAAALDEYIAGILK